MAPLSGIVGTHPAQGCRRSGPPRARWSFVPRCWDQGGDRWHPPSAALPEPGGDRVYPGSLFHSLGRLLIISIRVIVLEALCDVEETREHTDDEYSIRSEEQIVRHLTYRLRYYLTASLKGTIATVLPFCPHSQQFQSIVRYRGVRY